MTKIDIFSGFLGAGKTTLIKKLIAEGYKGERLVLIENEFGEIGIDGGFLKEAGIEITEMNSGCICCSLVGDFGRALEKVLDEFHPDRILIEPSGVGKLSDVIKAVEDTELQNAQLDGYTVVVDAKKCKMYMKNFGEFFCDQVEHAGAIVLSRTDGLSDAKLAECISLLREHNSEAVIVTTPWDKLAGEQLLSAISRKNTLSSVLEKLKKEAHHHHHDEECECGHHHHHDEECECGHHHHHDEECECGHHHHHDEECECGHHHHHDEECECGHHHHHDEECECGHHHHHADEVFTSFGAETARRFTKDELLAILAAMDSGKYGTILRAKGILPAEGEWLHFDYVPEESNIRFGGADIIGRLCVIGSGISKEALTSLFGL